MALFKRQANKSSDKPSAEKSTQLKKAADKTASQVKAAADKKASAKPGVAYKVLLHPLLTEKISLQNALNQYAFMVDKRANKVEIKQAIEELYNVKPTKVRIINMTGKLVPSGRGKYTRRKSWKKAIVSLPAGKKIDIYEGI